MFIYFWDRERQSMNGEGPEREGDTESEAGSRLWAVSTEPDTGLALTDGEIMTRAEVGRPTDWATQAPHAITYLNTVIDHLGCSIFLLQLVSTSIISFSWCRHSLVNVN